MLGKKKTYFMNKIYIYTDITLSSLRLVLASVICQIVWKDVFMCPKGQTIFTLSSNIFLVIVEDVLWFTYSLKQLSLRNPEKLKQDRITHTNFHTQADECTHT